MPHASLTRRDFLKIAAVSGGLAGCHEKPPRSEIVAPPVSPEAAPGIPAFYASVCRECPAGCGLIARHRDGRVIKVEGNPDHPIGHGGLCARGQASLQGLYDPDRVRTPLRRRDDGGFEPIAWDEAIRLTGERLAAARAAGSDRIALLSGLEAGSLERLQMTWAQALGSSRVLQVEPLDCEPLRAAMQLCFGADQVPRFDLTDADFILSLGADFLDTWISPVESARQFAALRRPHAGRMTALAYVGPRLSLTAAAADRRLYLPPGAEALVGLAILNRLLGGGRELALAPADRATLAEQVAEFTPEQVASRLGVAAVEIDAIAQQFATARAPVALAGSPLAAGAAAVEAAAAALLLDVAVGGVGRLRPHALGRSARPAAIASLLSDLRGRSADVLLISGANPVFALGAPVEEALAGVPWMVALTPFLDETAARAHLVLPTHTPLEAWGDFEPEEGVVGLQQPAMGAIHESRHAGDVLIELAAAAGLAPDATFGAEDFRGFLRLEWQARHLSAADPRPFETFWEEALKRGGIFASPPSAAPAFTLSPELANYRFQAAATLPDGLGGRGSTPYASPVIHAFPSIAFYDGRGANKSWLQELPDPVTKAVWGSWVEAHPETARELGCGEGELVRLTSPHGAIEAPLLVHREIARGVLAVPIGQGHARYGRHAAGRGANPLILLAPPWEAEGPTPVQASGLGRTGDLVVTARDFDPGERPIVPTAALRELDSEVAGEPFLLPLPESYNPRSDILPPHSHPEHRWAMAIDLNSCTGCSACVTACYAENNIPVVGKENVAEGREMAWITLQRYDVRSNGDPGAAERTTHVFLPMLCQHCDAAPCEPVCPVFASYHSEEGLNAQVYNRCIGTRYCSNNCPYKVRRFNWHSYGFPAPLHLQLNPDVTVRDKGVMEKCTFCVQRITAAKHRARRAGRPLIEGEVEPACAQTCPAQAIVFGDLLDPESLVSRLARGESRRYQVLGELRTRPAVTYLKKERIDIV